MIYYIVPKGREPDEALMAVEGHINEARELVRTLRMLTGIECYVQPVSTSEYIAKHTPISAN